MRLSLRQSHLTRPAMTNHDFVASVRAELRLILDPSNKPVQRGSPLWERLTELPSEGPCAECGTITKWYDEENKDWCCSFCRERIAAGQREDHRLDLPTYGQAEWINGQR